MYDGPISGRSAEDLSPTFVGKLGAGNDSAWRVDLPWWCCLPKLSRSCLPEISLSCSRQSLTGCVVRWKVGPHETPVTTWPGNCHLSYHHCRQDTRHPWTGRTCNLTLRQHKNNDIMFCWYKPDSWRQTSSNGNIFRINGPLWGEPPVIGGLSSQRPVTRSFDVFFDLRLNKRLSKQ